MYVNYQQILKDDEIKEYDIIITILFRKKSSAYEPSSFSWNTCRKMKTWKTRKRWHVIFIIVQYKPTKCTFLN